MNKIRGNGGHMTAALLHEIDFARSRCAAGHITAQARDRIESRCWQRLRDRGYPERPLHVAKPATKLVRQSHRNRNAFHAATLPTERAA